MIYCAQNDISGELTTTVWISEKWNFQCGSEKRIIMGHKNRPLLDVWLLLVKTSQVIIVQGCCASTIKCPPWGIRKKNTRCADNEKKKKKKLWPEKSNRLSNEKMTTCLTSCIIDLHFPWKIIKKKDLCSAIFLFTAHDLAWIRTNFWSPGELMHYYTKTWFCWVCVCAAVLYRIRLMSCIWKMPQCDTQEQRYFLQAKVEQKLYLQGLPVI